MEHWGSTRCDQESGLCPSLDGISKLRLGRVSGSACYLQLVGRGALNLDTACCLQVQGCLGDLREVSQSLLLLASWVLKTRPVGPFEDSQEALLRVWRGLCTPRLLGGCPLLPPAPACSLWACHSLPLFTDTNHFPCN